MGIKIVRNWWLIHSSHRNSFFLRLHNFLLNKALTWWFVLGPVIYLLCMFHTWLHADYQYHISILLNKTHSPWPKSDQTWGAKFQISLHFPFWSVIHWTHIQCCVFTHFSGHQHILWCPLYPIHKTFAHKPHISWDCSVSSRRVIEITPLFIFRY